MTCGEIKRFTLELINRYSVAGETVSPAYNNQSDIVNRIPNLINAALAQIALTLDLSGGTSHDTLPVEAPDAYELSVPDPWARAACYYAAAYLVVDENEFVYAALMNEFEAFLHRINAGRVRVRAEYTEVQSAYDFGGAEWLS